MGKPACVAAAIFRLAEGRDAEMILPWVTLDLAHVSPIETTVNLGGRDAPLDKIFKEKV
ncbi:hypothetical protein [Rhodococcus sp. T7]|uniref:hypothetical protein n=1 Tax=Rhodococcus sp. T7 TaxID=627444 RepID=UPI001359008B|nr:hypothetical protein [Rhodococcus sp. T7]